VPVVLLALGAATAVVQESADPRGRRLDAGGVALGIGFLLATTFAFIQAGRSGAASAPVIAAAVAAVALLAAFVRVEVARGEDAMLPLALFRRRGFSVANAAAGAMNLGTLGTLFVLTLFLQSMQGRSALAAGVAMVPLFAPLAILAPLAGRLTSRVGPRWPAVAGLLIGAAGIALLVRAEPDSAYVVLLPAFLLWGIGIGILTPAVVAAAIAAVPRERAGLASAINNTARQTGGAIGIAVAGAVAGQPGRGFVGGFHAVAIGAAALYAAVAALAALTLRSR
jgi:MFS transporter, DHA2 family, methylenomycin A resistance protein